MAKEDYLKMLGAPTPAMGPAEMPDMTGEVGVPDDETALDDMKEDTDPTSQDGDVIFLDPEMFANKPKKGDEVKVTCTVNTLGSKISLTPTEVESIDTSAEGEDDSEK